LNQWPVKIDYHLLYFSSAGNNFSLLTGQISLQIFLLVRHFTNWIGHDLLTDNTLKKITQDKLLRCLVIVWDHNVELVRHFKIWFGQCLVTNYYFQHTLVSQQRLKWFYIQNFNSSYKWMATLPYHNFESWRLILIGAHQPCIVSMTNYVEWKIFLKNAKQWPQTSWSWAVFAGGSASERSLVIFSARITGSESRS